MNRHADKIDLRRNDPLDLDRLAAMLSDKHDLHLVWPKARFAPACRRSPAGA